MIMPQDKKQLNSEKKSAADFFGEDKANKQEVAEAIVTILNSLKDFRKVIDDRLSDTKSQIDENSQELKAKLSDLEGRVKTISSDPTVKNLNRSLNSLSAEIEELKAVEPKDWQPELETLNSQLNNKLESKLENLNSLVTSVTGDFKKLKGQLQNVESALQSLPDYRSKLKNLEDNIRLVRFGGPGGTNLKVLHNGIPIGDTISELNFVNPSALTYTTGTTGRRANVSTGGDGSGDMVAATYDPQNIADDAFDTDNHTDGTVNKVFTATEKTKLSGIETSADVTDTTNVTAAGALMDSEVTNLAAVKAFDPTDYATAAQGSTADSALQDLVDDTTPQLGGALDANGNNITDLQNLSLDGTPDADHTATGMVTSSYNAGATIAAFQVCYMDVTATELLEADASAASTGGSVALVMSLEAGTDGNPMKVALPGSYIRDDTWNWTIGAPLYLSETAGDLTETKPTTADAVVRVVAHAYTADIIYFNPDPGWITVTG